MLKPSEDRTLAFFESLMSPNGIKELRDAFFNIIKESFISVNIEDSEADIITVFERDDYDNVVEIKNDFNDHLSSILIKEKVIAKELISSKSAKILSSNSVNSNFFLYTEATLLDLKNKSNNISYKIIHNTIIEIMFFVHSNYARYHNFSTEYLDTLSIYRKPSSVNKVNLTFTWKELNKKNEIQFLYKKLVEATPPFINSSLETFTKAFTNMPLEADEKIKWLCVSCKNKKIITKMTLVALIEGLFAGGYIVSDENDFNKTIENIFCKPNGVMLGNVKGTKKERSKNPTRILEIQAILQELSSIP